MVDGKGSGSGSVLVDLDMMGAFRRAYHLQDGGAVLVRPDGVIAWRSPLPPPSDTKCQGQAQTQAVKILASVFRRILALGSLPLKEFAPGPFPAETSLNLVSY